MNDQEITKFTVWFIRRFPESFKALYLEDLIQEAKISAWLALKTFKADKGTLVNWQAFNIKNALLLVYRKLVPGVNIKRHNKEFTLPNFDSIDDENLAFNNLKDSFDITDVELNIWLNQVCSQEEQTALKQFLDILPDNEKVHRSTFNYRYKNAVKKLKKALES